MNKNLPEIRNEGLQGCYQVLVAESPRLPALRVRAAQEVGQSLELGTASEWTSLPAAVRGEADRILSRLVVETGLEGDPAEVIYARPEESNLILDQGMNMLATYQYAQMGRACAVGTGTDPTYRDSGAITVSTSTTTATASAPFFNANDVGRLLKADTGEMAYVVTYNSTTEVVLSASLSLSTKTFTLWYVNQVGLGSEAQRTTTYLTGAGNIGSSRASNVCTWKWTYDGRVETGNQNYSELGFSPNGGAGNNLWARTLITGGAVTVLIGQRIRVVYSIVLTLTPTTPTGAVSTVTGWPVAPSTLQTGTYQLVGTYSDADVSDLGLVTLDSGGTPGLYGDVMGPSGNISMSLGTNTSIPTFLAGVTIANASFANSVALGAYTNGTFQRTKSGTWDLSTANRADWRSLFIVSAYGGMWQWLWNEVQTKDTLHTLTLTVLFVWTRTLTNP